MDMTREQQLEAALHYLLGATSDPRDPEHDPFWEAAGDYAASVDTHHVGTREIMEEARNKARAALSRSKPMPPLYTNHPTQPRIQRRPE
jgi:hypothetical protein